MRLADAISDALPPGELLRRRTAVIGAATANTATIILAGATITDVPYLSTYTPAVGDVVQVLTDGSPLILGTVA